MNEPTDTPEQSAMIQAAQTASDIWDAVNTALQTNAHIAKPIFGPGMRLKIAASLSQIFITRENSLNQRLSDMERVRDEALRELAQANEALSVLRSYVKDVNDLMSTQGEDLDAAIAVAKGLRDALACDAMWAFDDRDIPQQLQAHWNNGKGSLTSGPKNCREFYEKRKAALDSFRAAYPDL